MPDQVEITQMLLSLRGKPQTEHNALFAAIYDHLSAIAHQQLNRRRSGQTLDTAALVHEAYLKLIDQKQSEWQDRNHFFSVAALAMRHILVDHARRRKALKRGGNVEHTILDEGVIDVENRASEIVALDQALHQLAGLNERLSKVVELRFFGGLSVEETAGVLDVSARTVKRDWRMARAFLYSTLYDEGST